MPSSWKKSGGFHRLISGLRSNRAAAAAADLVVETGFPTSIADLVVRNHSRLKAPSLKKNKIPSPSPLRPAPPSPAPAAAAASPRRPCPVSPKNLGLGFLVAEMLALALLAVGEKQLVFRITIAASALMILDFLGFRVFEILTPCADARRRMNSAVGGVELKAIPPVSPVKEISAVSRSDSSENREMSSEGSVVSPKNREMSSEGSAVSSKNREMSSEGSAVSSKNREMSSEGSAVSDNISSQDSIKSVVVQKRSQKKLWRRLVPKRLRSKRTREKENAVNADRMETDCDSKQEVQIEEEAVAEALEVEIDNVDRQHFDTEVVAQPVCWNAGEKRSVSSRRLFLFVVLLFGLAGGRVAALAVTMAWFTLTRTFDTLWRKSRVHRVC